MFSPRWELGCLQLALSACVSRGGEGRGGEWNHPTSVVAWPCSGASQGITKEYRESHWHNETWEGCPKTTTALRALIEHYGLSSETWVAEVKRLKKGMVVWRFHWGDQVSYLDTKMRLARAVSMVVSKGRMLTRDELRWINGKDKLDQVGSKEGKGGRGHSTPVRGSTGKRRRQEGHDPAGHLSGAREGRPIAVYDSDDEPCRPSEKKIAMRKVGGQVMAYHRERGPRPTTEQLQVMKSEFVDKTVMVTGSITRIGMSKGVLCADLKLGEHTVWAQPWVHLQDRVQVVSHMPPASRVIAEQQEMLRGLSESLASTEAARDEAVSAQAATAEALTAVQAELEELKAAQTTDPNTEVVELRAEIERLKQAQAKMEQLRSLISHI